MQRGRFVAKARAPIGKPQGMPSATRALPRKEQWIARSPTEAIHRHKGSGG